VARKATPSKRKPPSRSPNATLRGRRQEAQLGNKGLDTRRRLVTAARLVFDEDGFVEARITDIADVAGAAHGSFYTYFESKEAIFKAVVDELLEEMNAVTFARDVDQRSEYEAIAGANERYYDAWSANAKTLAVLDEVAGFRPEFYERLTALRRTFVDHYSVILTQLQAKGIAAPDLNPYHSACALASMVEQSMRWWLGRGEPHDRSVALDTLNKLWARSIGLKDGTS
jgi:AcrR family transcriptional regulator